MTKKAVEEDIPAYDDSSSNQNSISIRNESSI